MLDRHDLTDEEWARLEPLLPSQKPQRGGRWADHRTVINGVFWRTRCGLPWRDVPPNYGPWKTVYNRHRRWSADGIWEEVLDELRRDADVGEGGEWTVGSKAFVYPVQPRTPEADVLAPVEVDTGGRVESQEIRGQAQPGSVGPLPGRVDLQDSPRR